MEAQIVEMHKKMDECRQAQQDAEMEAKQAREEIIRTRKDFEVLENDVLADRKGWQRVIEELE